MVDYILVAIFQLLFSILKVFDVKWSYENKVTQLTILNFFMSAIWILGTALGISAVIEGDVIMMGIYVFFGGIGKVIAIRYFDNKSYRYILYNNNIKNKSSP